jgi:Replication-relaxation
VGQLTDLLGIPRAPIERLERELIELGLLRAVDGSDLCASSIHLDVRDFARLGLVELTSAGRRRLADMLGLDAPTASRYHGLTGSARAATLRHRRLLRTAEHTVATNDVFVAFALAAADARRSGRNDELSEWRSATACKRRHCKPDGYGLYTRDGVSHGFLLEYDRGTESARKYAAKFRASYRHCDSGQPTRDLRVSRPF